MSKVLITDNHEIATKNEYVNKPIEIGINNHCKYCILSLLINSNKRKDSVKTNTSFTPKMDIFNYKYDSSKKFDELNKSLSDISDFDLEGKEELSFYNSSEEDNVIEEEVIIHKSKKRLSSIKIKDDEFENEIENEFKDLLKQLNIKRTEHK